MVCFFQGGEHGPCEGRLQWHHVIKQQRIRKEFPFGALWSLPALQFRPRVRWEAMSAAMLGIGFRSLDDILGDPRNRIWLCDRHHQLVTNARIYIPRSAMQSVEEFARDYGLEGWLDRYVPREEAV